MGHARERSRTHSTAPRVRLGWFALLAIVAVSQLAAAAPAIANHIAGATYNGTHSQGGAVSFTVTPDGSGLSSFSATGPIQGSTCTFGSPGSPITTTYVQPLPIVNHAFSDTSQTFAKAGSFTGPQTASGTLRIRTISPACDSGELTWTATTAAAPPPQPPPPGPPPPGPPPPPGGGNDIEAPLLRLSGRSSQSIARQRGVNVVAECSNEPCTVRARGTVSVPRASRVFRLKEVRRSLRRREQARLGLAFPRGALAAIRRALARGDKVRAKLTVTARDAAGNEVTRKRTVALKR